MTGLTFLEEDMCAVEALREAWATYSQNAHVCDGHTQSCHAQRVMFASCSCGWSKVERAIRDVIRQGEKA